MTSLLAPKEVAESLALWRNQVSCTLERLALTPPQNIELNDNKCAVFLETKRTPFSEFAIRNVVHKLGPGWGLCLYVDNSMMNWARGVVKDWGEVMVHPIESRSGVTTTRYLNQRMRQAEFWQSLPSEQLLIFDSGSMLSGAISNQYLQYDFIGSPWPDNAVSPWCRVGSGKFSLRKRSAMLDVVSRCNTNIRLIENEDVFFSIAMHLSRGRYTIPTPEVAAGFCVEQIYHPKPLAMHKAWMYLNREKITHLLRQM